MLPSDAGCAGSVRREPGGKDAEESIDDGGLRTTTATMMGREEKGGVGLMERERGRSGGFGG